MVRCTFVLLFAVIFAVANCAEDLYTDKFDYINATDILENERLRTQYWKCFMGEGPCVTADQIFFRGYLPEVMVTQCRRCTEKQKQNFDTIVSWYTENRPEEWKALVSKFITDAQAKAEKKSS